MSQYEGEKVPGMTSYNEAMLAEQVEGTKLQQGLAKEKAEMEGASPDMLKKYIAHMENKIQNDPRINQFPGLEDSYRFNQDKARSLLGEDGIAQITSMLVEAKKLGPEALAKAKETAIKSLGNMITSWNEKLQSGNAKPAETQKIQRLISDATTLRDSQFNA